MVAFLLWLILGTVSGAASLVLLLDWFEALRDPDPLAHEGFGLQVLIAVISAWIFVLAAHRVVTYLRRRDLG
jgi:formate-dependent nitrite reductase membrane component NrfD